MQRNAELVSCCVANCPSPPEPFGQRCGTSERPILDGGDRWFESGSLHQRVCREGRVAPSPRSANLSRPPRLRISARRPGSCSRSTATQRRGRSSRPESRRGAQLRQVSAVILLRGTGSSNPLSSSAEPANYQFRSRQAASAVFPNRSTRFASPSGHLTGSMLSFS